MKKNYLLMKKICAVMAVVLLLSCSEETTLVAVSGIEIRSEEYSLRPGETLQLTALLSPDDATGFDRAVWSSDDESVATVDPSGLVTGIREGEVTISVTTGYADASLTLRVGPDIYIVGDHGGLNTLWKNGRKVWSDGFGGKMSRILAQGGHTYIAAFATDPVTAYNHARLYVDGEATQLSGRFSEAYAVAVSGNDVYVAGCECEDEEYDMLKNRPVLWHNGVPSYLADYGYANDMVVAGADIYVAGFVTHDWNNDATLWKNGRAQKLSDSGISAATGIAVHGEDVYVSGSDVDPETFTTYAVVWKNGIPERYEEHAVVTDICVSPEGDLFASGYVVDYASRTASAAMWKNRQRIDLDSGGLEANAMSIRISGGLVYVAGITRQAAGISATRAVLWVDGTLVPLEDDPRTSATAYSVAIVE